MAGQASQAHLDVLAKQMGFRDYATWSAYQNHQRMMRQGNPPVTTGAPQQPAQQPQQAPQNWLQKLLWGLGGGQ